ncbi:hypothetical protein SASPL_151828 [Salvia splendens]|uniref:Uncharacterized protein n=1 Tax=Salvia splendens TaxID=180675 RepID=A0A8X8W2E1_SALSN|nr:uncharacterized protein LOC121783928 [Salvia splendens]KAG6386659.1 hypothetical protein SASPL_151828 [Salvia splendens]
MALEKSAEIVVEPVGGEGVRNQAPGLMLHRVPELVRREKNKNHIYEPQVVPLGPYHHREHPERELVEPLKNELRVKLCGGADRESSLLKQIHERIGEIRHFYGGADGFTDKELAEMMLRDACFLIGYMHGGDSFPLISRRLGMIRNLIMNGDMRMLENQIPFWLISLIHPHPKSLLCNYMNLIVFGDNRMPTQASGGGEEPIAGYKRITQLPWENGRGEEPLHLLEASRQTLLSLADNQENWVVKESSVTVWQIVNSQFRSVTDLKAKGIRFRRSSHCLTDIKFSSFAFYAELHLPSFYLTKKTRVYFSNIIAFEMSPNKRHTDFAVTTYLNFMKALIHNANDVKVLREKGILYGSLASDDEVVEMFKSIETYGCSNRAQGLFRDVKMRIEEHCNSKARTWMADLMKTNFRSPWTVIALVAAALLICLTFLQTFYTINPHI